LDGKAIHVHDVLADPEYGATDHQRAFGYRTILGVPLQRDGATIGVLNLTRRSVKPFSEKQIELAATFADQAVIAIENTRLFEAEQQRARDLTESLEQQTATAEVLRLISLSPGALAPVFDTILAKAMHFATRISASSGGSRAARSCRLPNAECRPPSRITCARNGPTGRRRAPGPTRCGRPGRRSRCMTTGKTGAISRAFRCRAPSSTRAAPLFVPMVSEGEVIGTIVIYVERPR
jgi:hypothetical protein